MKMDSGSHPHLYKIGMKLYKVDPKLWDVGMKTINLPGTVKNAINDRVGDKKKAALINNVNIELSVVCNLRCSFCWWWGEQGIAFKLFKERDPLVTQELNTQEIYNVVDQLARHKPSIYLSGGEPFIRKDTVDIIEYISKKGMAVLTNNNGTVLSDEKLQRLAKIKNLTINFSIDGTREIHDKIRGKGMYDKTTSTIRKLIEYRGKGNMLPAIKTNTTFSPWLLGHVDELIRNLQDDVGVDAVRMQHLWFTDKEHAERHKTVLNDLFGIGIDPGVDAHVITRPTQEYAEQLAKEIATVEKTKYKKPVFMHPKFTSEQIKKYYMDLNWSKESKCRIAWNYILVKANGDVMFCPDEWMTKFKLGNARTESIDSMWTGEKAQKFRETLDKVGLFPACTRCCAING